MKTEIPAELRRAFAVLGLLFIVGAQGAAGASKKDLAITLKEQKVEELTSSGLVLAFHLNIADSSASPYFLTGYSYQVLINQREYLNLPVVLDQPLEIRARGETLISLPIKINSALLFEAIPGVEEKAVCDLTGEMVFADSRKREERIPFAASGSFPIFKDPEVELLPLKVRDLTIGGSDLSFEVRFKNPNSFDLIVDKISYSLVLAGQKISDGSFGGNKNIDAKGDKVFSLPLLLDFSELGKEVYDAFQNSAVPCHFSGEMEVSTIWGQLRIPFDKTGDIPVSKTS